MCQSIPVAHPLQPAAPNCGTAKSLGPVERMTLGVQALAGHQSISHLADDAHVSRKFVYQQADIAQSALDDAFVPTAHDDQVLFHLPVTKVWLRQVTLGLTLICHSSYRGVVEFFRDLLDVPISLGTVQTPLCPHRLDPVCTLLTNQRDNLLAFAQQLETDLTAVAEHFHLPADRVRAVLDLQAMDPRHPQHWHRDAQLRRQLGHERFRAVSQAVREVAAAVVRASSVIENLNIRLRNYFFLRRHRDTNYLPLLQFFLNHRRFLRSEHPDRVDQSPAELLTGQPHPHWLELLGYRRWAR